LFVLNTGKRDAVTSVKLKRGKGNIIHERKGLKKNKTRSRTWLNMYDQ